MILYRNRIKRRLLIVDSDGIGFAYHGDEVIWLWPWKRKGNFRLKWLSIEAGRFRTLAEVDKYWEEFNARVDAYFKTQELAQAMGRCVRKKEPIGLEDF